MIPLSPPHFPAATNLEAVVVPKGLGTLDYLFNDKINALKKDCALSSDVSAALERLEELLIKSPKDRCATYKIPEALHLLGLAAQESAQAEIISNVKNLTSAILVKLATEAIYYIPVAKGQTHNLSVIGEGRSNWVLSDSEQSFAIIIPKVPCEEGFKNLKLRRWAGKHLDGLQQPKIHRIASLPILHAISDFARGESLQSIFAMIKSEQRPLADLKVAVAAVGKLMRDINARDVLRYGRIKQGEEPGKRGEWSGAHSKLRHSQGKIYKAFLSSSKPSQFRQYAQDHGLMTIEQQEQLTVVAKELFGKDHRPMLTHIDPHLGNFIYDTETKRASALDWDSATFTSEARMLGRIYHFFSQYSAETGQVRDLLFRNFLAGYKDDPESHESAYNTAIYSATIDFYSHLNSFVTKYTKERGVAPELPQLPLLESTLVGRIKHNLKLIESKKWPTPSL